MKTQALALSSLIGLARPVAVAAAMTMTAVFASAQTIDDIVVSAQGSNMVALINFNGTVRLIRQSPVTAAQLLRIEFELVAADESVLLQATEESRNVAGTAGAPDLRVTYVAVPRERVKRLTLQLSRAAVVRTRQGPNSHSLELVIAGSPTAAAKPAAPATPITPASDRRFAVTLQTVPLAAQDQMLPVPKALQNYDAFSVAVVVDGVPSVQVNLGYFETEDEARRVLALAKPRFPDAAVLDLAARREAVLKSA
jgi:hypothetical protein